MSRNIRRWEMALLVGIVLALLWGSWTGQEQRELADSLIRLHVIANSDSEEDQALKLKVRDQVLERAEELYPEGATREEVYTVLENSLEELVAVGRTVVEEQGYDYPISAYLTRSWFPTKEYDDFALPAGNYTALQVVIGEGAGRNWWCVAFPPLCLGAAGETVEEAAQVGHFSQEQVALITEADQGYVLKFKSMELLGRLQGLFA